MNRCSVCDITDEDKPDAGITLYSNAEGVLEPVCSVCAYEISENLTDLRINDPDDNEVDSDWYKATLS